MDSNAALLWQKEASDIPSKFEFFFFFFSFEVFIDHINIDIGVTVISIIYNKINQVTIIINQQ